MLHLCRVDALDLNPYTVTSVADENGAVQDDEPLDHLPPRR
ncbi:hypothetical protein N8K70_07500 [Microbacterium betulae]|uniref:Uncharacterized protein n=1 Tax=Microbacterium betulae TaxID=2981139 RepID=A0AA97FKJ0_9MICO|nr:hypothetical protein [Microbacterium sp. AB]WOF24499.1 hypothetical protein N8K70_07500 [Microbacterium sp. AB]